MSNSKVLIAILGGAAAAAALAYLFASDKGKELRGGIGDAAENISKKVADKVCDFVDGLLEDYGKKKTGSSKA
jgi:gas vesicle protein